MPEKKTKLQITNQTKPNQNKQQTFKREREVNYSGLHIFLYKHAKLFAQFLW